MSILAVGAILVKVMSDHLVGSVETDKTKAINIIAMSNNTSISGATNMSDSGSSLLTADGESVPKANVTDAVDGSNGVGNILITIMGVVSNSNGMKALAM